MLAATSRVCSAAALALRAISLLTASCCVHWPPEIWVAFSSSCAISVHDRFHGLNDARRRHFNRGNLLRDVAGRLFGLRSECLDLLGDHGKAASGSAPARAASIVALSASKLVCAATSWMKWLTLLICPTADARCSTVLMTDLASPEARRALSAEPRAWLEIFSTD